MTLPTNGPSSTTTGNHLAVRPDRPALHREDILEPGLPVIDAHPRCHDRARAGWRYPNAEYTADAASGHDGPKLGAVDADLHRNLRGGRCMLESNCPV